MALTELEAFETRDVGSLSAEGGVTQTFQLGLQDEGGAPMDPALVLKDPSAFSVWVFLSFRAEDRDRGFLERFPVELSRPVVFKGLPPGEYNLRWDFKTQPELLDSPEEMSRSILPGGQYTKPMVLGGTTVIPVVVETKVAVSLEPPPVPGMGRPKIKGRVFSVDHDPEWITFEADYERNADGKPMFARFVPSEVGLYPGLKGAIF